MLHMQEWCVWTVVIIIIIKTSIPGTGWKYKIVYKLLAQPHKHLRHWKFEKPQLKEATTVHCTLKPTQRSGVKHSVGKVISHSNQGRQETLQLRRMLCMQDWYVWNDFMLHMRDWYVWNAFMLHMRHWYVWNALILRMQDWYVWNLCVNIAYARLVSKMH